eukprot:1917981-Amphidinium_carterae.1
MFEVVAEDWSRLPSIATLAESFGRHALNAPRDKALAQWCRSDDRDTGSVHYIAARSRKASNADEGEMTSHCPEVVEVAASGKSWHVLPCEASHLTYSLQLHG